MIINLGCGKTKIPGVAGVDSVYIEGYTDIVHNLENTPYPFDDSSVDEVHFYHVLEHLENPLKKIEEIHRILKPGGRLNIRVPHFSSSATFTDITHKRGFSIFSFDIFEKDNYHSFYSESRFEINHKRINYLGLYPNSGIYEKYIHSNQCPFILRPFVRGINWLINTSPYFFERIWCYWVGGACEVQITMTKI
jgi:SAM-dependent methyltransferase